ncbi:hypothetical protein F2P81_020710 [Scophthalmus maximus]|uniref:Uncharacterized protein n=1 Tax=Scophthalmus maximus TaxID=52904 RepID=A0A6A4S5Y8_SCOMX|nr:hypothetical protein F2P81_020710 [Scophthalmus maximus]
MKLDADANRHKCLLATKLEKSHRVSGGYCCGFQSCVFLRSIIKIEELFGTEVREIGGVYDTMLSDFRRASVCRIKCCREPLDLNSIRCPSPTVPPLHSEHFKPCHEKDLAYCLNGGECFVIETLSGPHKHCKASMSSCSLKLLNSSVRGQSTHHKRNKRKDIFWTFADFVIGTFWCFSVMVPTRPTDSCLRGLFPVLSKFTRLTRDQRNVSVSLSSDWIKSLLFCRDEDSQISYDTNVMIQDNKITVAFAFAVTITIRRSRFLMTWLLLIKKTYSLIFIKEMPSLLTESSQ